MRCVGCSFWSLLAVVGWIVIGLLVGKLMLMRPTQPASLPPEPKVEHVEAPSLAPVQTAPRVEVPVTMPPPLATSQPEALSAGHPALGAASASWAEIERVLYGSVLVQSPVELREVAMPSVDVWAVLQAEHEFHERMRVVMREKPITAPFSERKYWHESRFVPWLDVELPLFVDQLHRLRVPAGAVDRFYHRMLEHR